MTDVLALGVYQAFKDGGEISRDIAAVGMGNDENADFFDPLVTCVGPSNETIVEQVMTQLARLMTDRRVKCAEIFVPPW